MRSTLPALLTAGLMLFLTSCEEPSTPREKQIEARERASNGIAVGKPKVYDDSVLQMMLNNAQSRLVSLQVLDQTGIASRLGSITGANQQISSFAISAQGPPTPQSVVTANGATSQVAATVKPTASDNSTVTTTNAPVQNVVTTIPQFGPPTATAPAPSTSLPSSFSVSASDILNEQMQLTYEIANYNLLIGGPLNDHVTRVTRSNGQIWTVDKPHLTLGFPIAINPDKRFKDAVAVVEVEVETLPDALNDEPPAIAALLPREKTYNVAAIKDHSGQIGAGVVTQVAGVSGSYLFGRKTYYVVKDQDTVALTFKPEAKDSRDEQRIGFLWEFRPVLGESYVKSGLKQTFVQLAFPAPAHAPVIGKVLVRTYWRKYDKNTGLAKEIISNSLHEEAVLPIPTFPMEQKTPIFGVTNMEDLNGGQMLVRLEGSFLGGTYVRVGSTILQTGSNGFTTEYGGIRFTASIADLALKKTVLVTRDGTETPIYLTRCGKSDPFDVQATVAAIDETNSLLKVTMDDMPPSCGLPVILIGGKAFGYSDAPIKRETDGVHTTLSVLLPTGFLFANPDVAVHPVLADFRYVGKTSVFAPDVEPYRLLYLRQDADNAYYLVYGRGLDDVDVVSPDDLDLEEVITNSDDSDTMRTLKVPLKTAKSLKALVLQSKHDRPFVVSFPSLPTTDPAKAGTDGPKFQERVTVGADEAVVIGDDLGKVQKVMFQKQELTNIEKSDDGKSLKIKGLAAAGVTAVATTQSIDLILPSGKTTVKLEVVNSKVENVTK
jgi:hypothetical protein